MDLDPRLAVVDAEQLLGPVRRLHDDEHAQVESFHVEPLDGPSGNPATLGLRVVRGTASGRDGVRPFALVRKAVHDVDLPFLPRAGYSERPEDWNYWKREVVAYESGLLDDVDGEVTPGRCLGTQDHGDWAVLWLELLQDHGDAVWPVADLAASAGALGELSGRQAGRPPSRADHPWLVEGFIPAWLTTMRTIGLDRAVEDDDLWRSPDLRGVFPVPLSRRLGDLLRDAPELLAAGNALPATLAHHDTGRRNLFRSSVGGVRRWTLVDWSFVGVAPVGQDLGHAVGLNAFHHDVPPDPDLLDEYERAAAQAYLDGLRRAGVDPPPVAVRGYARAVPRCSRRRSEPSTSPTCDRSAHGTTSLPTSPTRGRTTSPPSAASTSRNSSGAGRRRSGGCSTSATGPGTTSRHCDLSR